MSVITTTDMSDGDEPQPRKHGKLWRRLLIGAAVAVIVIVVAVIVARLYVDWLWFGEVGLRTIFWKRLVIGAVTAVAFAAAFFAVVYGNLRIAKRLAPRYRPIEGIDVIEMRHEDAVRWVGRIGLIAAREVLLLGFPGFAPGWF